MTMDSTCDGVRRLTRASLLLLTFAQTLPIFVAESQGYFAAEGLPSTSGTEACV